MEDHLTRLYQKMVRIEPPTHWLPMAERWYTIQLIPSLLETAEVNLKRQNFIPFFPSILIKKSRKTTVTEPMFKGYGFVLFDPLVDRWLSINGTRGVIGLLPRHAKMPQPMIPGFVERLREKDPVDESEFLEVFDEFFPGITEIEVTQEQSLVVGRRGLVVGVRATMLQVSFNFQRVGDGQPVWLDRESVTVIPKD